MPLDMGPLTFQVVGTFTEKPRLLINGEEVAYGSLRASYYPAETIEYASDDIQDYPEAICLEFSLSSQMGQLEANVNYRVKANDEGRFLVARVDDERTEAKQQKKKIEKVKLDDKKPVNVQKKDPTMDPVETKTDAEDHMEEEKKKEESPKDKKEMPKKEKKGYKKGPKPEAGSREFVKDVRSQIIENIVVEDNE